MKKISFALLTLVAFLAISYSSLAQNTFPTSGYVGIGTTTPSAGLDIANVSNGVFNFRVTGGYTNFNATTLRSTYGTSGHLWDVVYGDVTSFNYYDGTVWATPFSFNSSGNLAAGTVSLYGAGSNYFAGNVGIGTDIPLSMFQVDDGVSKASIGDASGSALYYGTSYLGFNASRTSSGWSTNNDAVSGATGNNGGGVIYSSVFGDMYFAPIGTTGGSAGQALADGNIANDIALHITPTGTTYAKQIIVNATAFPDYVFKPEYKLRSLSEVKTYIDQNQHLPDMPSAAEVEKDGLNVGEMNKLLTKKVEELTLYLIEKDKELKEQQTQLNVQEEKLAAQADQQEKMAKQLEALANKIKDK